MLFKISVPFGKSLYSPNIPVPISMTIKSFFRSVSQHTSCILCITKLKQKMVMLENKNQHQLCLMKEFFQGRLPLSFGLHPQKISLLNCTWLTIRINGFVQRLSSVVCWHYNSLYQGRFYVWAAGLCLLCWGLLYRGSLYQGSIPYIFLSLRPGHRMSFVISRTSLNRGLLNRGSTVAGLY